MKWLLAYCDFGGVDGAEGAGGASGCVDDDPAPVVLAGGVIFGAVLLLVVVEEPLLAVLVLLFQPAMIRKPISNIPQHQQSNPTFRRRRSHPGVPPDRLAADR